MVALTFDDPALLEAMRAFVQATDALGAAASEADLLNRSEAATMAGLALRKRLLDLGWSAPAGQRSTT